MKTLAKLLVLVSTAICCEAQIRPTSHDWNATLKVIDDAGQPVANATVWISYSAARTNVYVEQGGKISGVTDTNGIFTASHNDPSEKIGFHAQKGGYYSTATVHEFGFDETDTNVVWNPIKVLTLVKIGKPIAMYAKWIRSEPAAFRKTGRPPIDFDKTLGFDLMAGDWVAPYGKGINTDIIFNEIFDKRSASDFDYKLTLSFPNKGDGIQDFSMSKADDGSDLHLFYKAPSDGYQAKLLRAIYRHPGQADKVDYDTNRNYFFRVHTLLDSNGNVKSALYGKIYGDPDQMNFRYYLNPTPNDRNIEFDPKQNLIQRLQSFEQVDTP